MPLRVGGAGRKRPFFRVRQIILRDGDQVHGLVLHSWMQKAVVGVLVVGLLWGSGATLAFWHQAMQADAAAEAYRAAVADLARQQMRIADISRGLTGQRAALGKLMRDGEGQPLGALEGEIAGLLTQVAALETTLAGIDSTLQATLAERQAIQRERETLNERVREVERRGQDRARELERQLATANTAHEETLASLAQRARATVSEVERILAEAGLEPARMVPGQPADRTRRGGRGGPFVPASANAAVPAAALATRLREGAQGVQQETEWLHRLGTLLEATPIAVPLAPGYQVESGFGRRIDPIRGLAAIHTGLDLSDSHGKAVHATAPGRVAVAGWEGGYGRVVEIDHGFGLRTRYAHLSSLAVRVDQQISRFTRVGALGSSGRSTGAHLHYEVLLNGRQLDPARFMQGAYIPVATSSPTTTQGGGLGR